MNIFSNSEMITMMQGTTEDGERYATEYKKYFLDAVFHHTLDTFCDESKKYDYALDFLKQYFNVEKDDEKRKIYNLAMIDTIRNLSAYMVQKQPLNINEYSSYKYVLGVVQTLYEYGALPVVMIAKYMNVERHALTNGMTRAKKLNLWTNEKIGKCSIYKLTAKGENLYEQYKENNTVNDNRKIEGLLTEYTNVLIQYMVVDKPDITYILRELSKKQDINISRTSVLHLKIQDLYEKRELYTKKCVSKIKEAKKEWDQMDDFGITYSLDYQDLKETYESEFVEYVREIGKERKYGKNNIAVNRIN